MQKSLSFSLLNEYINPNKDRWKKQSKSVFILRSI